MYSRALATLPDPPIPAGRYSPPAMLIAPIAIPSLNHFESPERGFASDPNVGTSIFDSSAGAVATATVAPPLRASSVEDAEAPFAESMDPGGGAFPSVILGRSGSMFHVGTCGLALTSAMA
jgi:hypothetical protein